MWSRNWDKARILCSGRMDHSFRRKAERAWCFQSSLHSFEWRFSAHKAIRATENIKIVLGCKPLPATLIKEGAIRSHFTSSTLVFIWKSQSYHTQIQTHTHTHCPATAAKKNRQNTLWPFYYLSELAVVRWESQECYIPNVPFLRNRKSSNTKLDQKSIQLSNVYCISSHKQLVLDLRSQLEPEFQWLNKVVAKEAGPNFMCFSPWLRSKSLRLLSESVVCLMTSRAYQVGEKIALRNLGSRTQVPMGYVL